jgi:hypothetical protein
MPIVALCLCPGTARRPVAPSTFPWLQSIVQHQGLLDVLVEVLQFSSTYIRGFDETNWKAQFSSHQLEVTTDGKLGTARQDGAPGGQEGAVGASMAGNGGGEMMDPLWQSVIYALRLAMLDNESNQLYVARHMSVILGYSRYGTLAAQCVTEMLETSKVHRMVRDAEVKKVLNIMQSENMQQSAVLLDVLRAFCSCQGRGTDWNQRRMVKLLSDPTLTTHDQLQSGKGDSKAQQERRHLMMTLVDTGKSSASQRWIIKHMLLPKGGEGFLANAKQPALDFFSAQLDLFAEMCLDRNYTGIRFLKETTTGDGGGGGKSKADKVNPTKVGLSLTKRLRDWRCGGFVLPSGPVPYPGCWACGSAGHVPCARAHQRCKALCRS